MEGLRELRLRGLLEQSVGANDQRTTELEEQRARCKLVSGQLAEHARESEWLDAERGRYQAEAAAHEVRFLQSSVSCLRVHFTALRELWGR